MRPSKLGSCLGVAMFALGCGNDVAPGTGSGSSTGSESGETGCPIGSEGCPCTQGGYCDGTLVCLSNLCVDPTTGDGDGDGDGAPGDGDGDGMPGDGDGDGDGTPGDGDGDGTPGDGDGDGDGSPGNWNGDYPSCADLPMDACGGDNCCATDGVQGGWFAMGRGAMAACGGTPMGGQACTPTFATCQSGMTTWGCPEGTWVNLGGLDMAAGGDDETPEHAARVSGFGLDRYEVSVARMRAFIDAYDKPALLTALDGGAGAHPLIPGSGWQDSWDFRLPDTAAALEMSLACDGSATWTSMPGSNETYPLNCTSWYIAYAFCAWDEGRLPTEAEWERAAIGGDENRLYPWGSDAPTAALANYSQTDNSTNVDVFAKPAGAGRWGHQGIAGSVWEWTLDLHAPGWYAGAGNDCQNCANVQGDAARTMRGGDWQYNAISLRGAERFPGSAGAYWLGAGIRCARD